jgi:hypothetical protein
LVALVFPAPVIHLADEEDTIFDLLHQDELLLLVGLVFFVGSKQLDESEQICHRYDAGILAVDIEQMGIGVVLNLARSFVSQLEMAFQVSFVPSAVQVLHCEVK